MTLQRTGRVNPRPAHRVDMPLKQRRQVTPVQAVPLWRSLVLIFMLPFFAQVFHYTLEMPPPYYLSKIWPILMLPFTLYAVFRMRLPGRDLFFVLLAYMIGFTPLISVMQLGNNFIDAMTTTVKVWPFTYYFALAGALSVLALPMVKVKRIFLGFGVLTFIMFVVLWVLAPDSWYATKPEDGKLLQYDNERGNRVYLSTIFGMILVFYLGRSFIAERKWSHLFYMLVAYVIMLLIYKQRLAIASALVVTALGMVMTLPERWRRLVIGMGVMVGLPLGLVALGYMGLFTQDGMDAIIAKIGGSLSVRQNSSALALAYLGESTERWVFGVGATTRFGSFTLSEIFGYQQFFISDLGWLGVLFEYGLIGALLILGLHIWAAVAIYRNGIATGDRFQLVMGDYVLYLILTSAVYSLVFVPGELGVVLAVAMYAYSQCVPKAKPQSPSRVKTGHRPTAPDAG